MGRKKAAASKKHQPPRIVAVKTAEPGAVAPAVRKSARISAATEKIDAQEDVEHAIDEDVLNFLLKFTQIVIQPVTVEDLAQLYFDHLPVKVKAVKKIQEDITRILKSILHLEIENDDKAMILYTTQTTVITAIFNQIIDGENGIFMELDYERKIARLELNSIIFNREADVESEECPHQEMKKMMTFIYESVKANRKLSLNEICKKYEESSLNDKKKTVEDVRVKLISVITCATPSDSKFLDSAAFLVNHFGIPPTANLKKLMHAEARYQLNDKGYLNFYIKKDFVAGKINDCQNPTIQKFEKLKGVMMAFYNGMEDARLPFFGTLMGRVMLKIQKLSDDEEIEIMTVRKSLESALQIVKNSSKIDLSLDVSISIQKVLRILSATAVDGLVGPLAGKVQMMVYAVMKEYELNDVKVPHEMVLKALTEVLNIESR